MGGFACRAKERLIFRRLFARSDGQIMRGAVVVEPYLALVKSDEALEKSIQMLKRVVGEQNKSMD